MRRAHSRTARRAASERASSERASSRFASPSAWAMRSRSASSRARSAAARSRVAAARAQAHAQTARRAHNAAISQGVTRPVYPAEGSGTQPLGLRRLGECGLELGFEALLGQRADDLLRDLAVA